MVVKDISVLERVVITLFLTTVHRMVTILLSSSLASSPLSRATVQVEIRAISSR